MMNRRENSDSIPMDLIPQILSRLPAKSVARFCCVSKPWKSIICSQDFTELFRTMSSSKPRLLFRVEQSRSVDWKSYLIDGHHIRTKFRFYSSPQPQNHYGKSSLVVAADLHTKFSEDSPCYFSYASGLFYFTKVGHEDDDDDGVRVICNPITGQYAILPPIDLITTYRTGGGLLGFDPIGKQFKILVPRVDDIRVYHILTLGTEKLRWREIRCPSRYGPDQNSSGICINGVLYYQITFDTIGYFDVRSEEFKFINVDLDGLDWFENLINYKGKLCGIELQYGYYDGGFPIKLCMWVLEDVEKREWSPYVYTLSAEDKAVKVNYDLSVVGVTASGEIVLVKNKVDKPFYVFYFNPETNTLRSVKIQGVREEEEYHSVCCFVDHVEDLNFDVMKTTYGATTSLRPSTSTSCREDRQVRTVAHVEQDCPMFETVNKFDALNFLEDEDD